MRGKSREERPGPGFGKMAVGQRLRGLHCGQAKARHEQRVMRNAKHRSQAAFGQFFPPINEGPHEASPGFAVGTELLLGVAGITFEHDGSSIVQGVGKGGFAMHPFQPVISERKGVEEW